MTVAERARKYVERMAPAVAGAGGHDATFHAASVLVHGFGLSVQEALPLMQEFNARCQPPWAERDLLYKLNSAERAAHSKPRGHLRGEDRAPRAMIGGAPLVAAPAPVFSPRKLACEFDAEKLRGLAARWREVVDVEWLANRSAVDPCGVGPAQFLELLYGRGEKVLVFSVYESQGQAFWPSDELPQSGENGVWYLAQPVNGLSLPNPRTGKMSRRSMESVTAFRYLVLESDRADVRDWLGLLVQLPLQIEAIYTSGGKSVHALVRVDCRTHQEWEDYARRLQPTLNLLGIAGVDPKTLTSVRLTRLPGCWRGERLQKLLYVQPRAEVRCLAEMPVVRDVCGEWLAQANAVIDGHGEASVALRRALWYYGPVSESCRVALKDLGGL